MDAVAAKSDAVTAWKCTATDAYRRLPTLTDADSRCGAFAPSACDRVNPYPSVTGPLLIPSVMSSSDSIIEGALIAVGEKQDKFLLISPAFPFIFCYYSYNQVNWCLQEMFNEL